MSSYQKQYENEERFTKNQLSKKINSYFTAMEGFTEFMDSLGVELDFALSVLRNLALRKRAPADVMFGILSHFDDRTIVDGMNKLIAASLVKYEYAQFIVVLELDAKTQQEIDKYQYPIPMIIPPRELIDNKSSGYILPMGSLILKNKHHDDDICIDVLNLANSIEYTFNLEVIRDMKNEWANINEPKQGESKEKFEKRKKAFAKYSKTSIQVIAEIAEASPTFYFTHKRDTRLRMYCQGYHMNYQGHTWNKANVLFANGEILDD